MLGRTRLVAPTYSIVIPLFRSESSLDALLERLDSYAADWGSELEVVFVDDGSPDRCSELLAETLPARAFQSSLVRHARNFGSFAAIATGMRSASGQFIAVMAADLQEPEHLIRDFFADLKRDECDVVVGVRRFRADSFRSRVASRIFWTVYCRLVQREMPRGGVDVFACTQTVSKQLANMEESHSSLVGMLIWLGFRRKDIPYDRQERHSGRSAWSIRKRFRYLSDSVYSFTDMPIHLLLAVGIIGIVGSLSFAIVVAVAKLAGLIDVPGYAATIIVISFLSALNMSALGVVGAYVWRAYENTKGRPNAIVRDIQRIGAGGNQ